MKTDHLIASVCVGCQSYWRPATLAAVAVFFALGMGKGASGQAMAPQNPPRSHREESKELALKITAPFTLAAVGDLIELQPLTSQDPAYLQLINHISSADVGFGNMEISLVDLAHFQGAMTGTLAPMEVGPAIKDMGIKIVNHANNHVFDGGAAGMFSTDAALDQLGIVHAGTGRDLNEARAAHFLETPKGRVGVVGMFSVDDISSFGPNYEDAEATYRVGYTGGAPGVNPLHLTAYHIVSPEQLQSLRAIRDAVYGHTALAAADDAAVGGSKDRLKFFDEWYEAGPNPGALSYTMDANDERDILDSIRNGKILSDFMIATIHVHQTSNFETQFNGGIDHMAPDFLVKLAHEAIDNGADVFVGHGAHCLRGVEIYKGKPIFYGMSNFILLAPFQPGATDEIARRANAVTHLPVAEATQEAILTTSRYEAGRLVEVRIYPVDVGGPERPISQVGIPRTPSPEVAQRILEELQTISKPFGTTISIENNVGVIHVAPAGTEQGRK